MRFKQLGRGVAIAAFGIICPILLIFQAYSGLDRLHGLIGEAAAISDPVKSYESIRPKLRGGMDYSLFATMHAERTNLMVVSNKQIMKIAVMQIGFAVISLGLMFITIGINAGGAETTLEGAGLKLDFKSSSTGAVVFVIGAAMASAGGLMKNEYSTVPIPAFVHQFEQSTPDVRHDAVEWREHLDACLGQDDVRAKECIRAAVLTSETAGQ